MEPPNQINKPKITLIHVFIVVGLIIAAEVIWVYRSLILPNNQKTSGVANTVQKIQIVNKISLTTPKNEVKVGDAIPVTINIEANKQTAGVDLVMRFDPNLLAISDAVKPPVTVGNIYTDYPINKLDGKQGIILVSGITSNTAGIIPKGVFGTILFKAKAAGNAKIFLEFSKGSTVDTNITENKTAKDVLEEVDNLNLVIKP